MSIPNRDNFAGSREYLQRASQYLAGGVNSNFRLGISPTPLTFDHAEGAVLIDIDGNRLIDYYLGMGPMILGHTPASVIRKVAAQLGRGILYAGQSELELEAARLLAAMVPSAERIRFCSSGSEAVQGAIRLARAVTGRRKILKFEGHYHGWFDNILWSVLPTAESAGPRAAPNLVPASAGQLEAEGTAVVVLPWNDSEAVARELHRREVAAVIMEPAMCNAGGIAPEDGYLAAVQQACRQTGTLLIFDETITGFRLAPGGAQQLFGVTPDIATFAKAIASGFPVAAITGKAEILDRFAIGDVMHGGTYNSQCLAMTATVATLEEVGSPGFHADLARKGARLMDGIRQAVAEARITATVTGFPAVFHVAFGLRRPAREYRDLFAVDRKKYVAFTTALLRRGVRALERGTWFLSSAHTDTQIEDTIAAVKVAAHEIAAAREGP
jgi:glutamate-1-semialdehyde 2,1-aminomutase